MCYSHGSRQSDTYAKAWVMKGGEEHDEKEFHMDEKKGSGMWTGMRKVTTNNTSTSPLNLGAS